MTIFLLKRYMMIVLNHVILRTGWNVGINKESRCVVSLTYKTLLSENAKMAFNNSFLVIFDFLEIKHFRFLVEP